MANGLWVLKRWALVCVGFLYNKRTTARDMPRYVTSRYVTSIFVFPQEMQLLRFLPFAPNIPAISPFRFPAKTRYPFFRLPSFTFVFAFAFAFCCHFNIGAGVFLLAVAAVTITRGNSHNKKKMENIRKNRKKNRKSETITMITTGQKKRVKTGGENPGSSAQRKVHISGQTKRCN